MTRRERQLSRVLLDLLHASEGKPMPEADLLQAAARQSDASISELLAALREADSFLWVAGFKSNYAGQVWAITDAGEAARPQLQ